MIEQVATTTQSESQQAKGITSLSVGGFKSIVQLQTIEIKPLTILAGANSSGKSSLIQPLLMLKQTLNVPYEPEALLLDGPNVEFTSPEQFLSDLPQKILQIKVGLGSGKAGAGVEFLFRPQTQNGKTQNSKKLEIQQVTYAREGQSQVFRPGMNSEEIAAQIPLSLTKFFKTLQADEYWKLSQDHCFLLPFLVQKPEFGGITIKPPEVLEAQDFIARVIHVPGVRGNVSRTYRITNIGSTFPGRFDNSAASSVLLYLPTDKLESLNSELASLELGTSQVIARQITDVEAEVRVSRLKQVNKNGKKEADFVSVADVGLGVSQTLPILVALQVAHPGQLVYIEQPEIHLHPHAQATMAQILANAAKRGVQVVVETHSDLLLLSIQTLVAEDKLSPDLVKLHWFSRDKNGVTKITSADLDRKGAFGDWPEDFGETNLKAQNNYLDAVTLYREKERNARKSLEKPTVSN